MSNDPNRPLKVFLCHAHSDRDAVKVLYARLKREGVDVWLDKEKLLPGADWEYEIRKAVREADVVVVCLSKQFNQDGFRQKEVRIALDAAMEKREGEIFIIPARLEECDNLESLSKWHWVDLFESDGFQRLILALRVRAQKIGATLRQHRGGHATISRPKIDAKQEAARERTEQEVIEKTRLEAEELERQKTVKEKAGREAAEKAAHEKAEQDALEKARLDAEELERRRIAKEQVDRETVEIAAREKKEKETARINAKARAEERASQPKKANSNTVVILALVGLVGIICAMLVGPPLLGKFFSPQPTATLFLTPTKTKTPAPSKTPTHIFTPTVTATHPPTTAQEAFNPYPESDDFFDDKGISMRLVPAGNFTMGSDAAADEKPIHKVYLDAFYMDKYEVTNILYKACVEAGGCTLPHDTSSSTRPSYYSNSEFDDYPVIYVDWNQAKAYCEWRDASMPTEAQWEKAARGTDGRTYPWGEGISCNQVNYWGRDDGGYCVDDTTKVGSYANGKSPYGIYDLAGNVWEWVSSLYRVYPYVFSDGREDLMYSSGNRVVRGGSNEFWIYSDYHDYRKDNVRSANRYFSNPTSNYSDFGFRCARSLP